MSRTPSRNYPYPDPENPYALTADLAELAKAIDTDVNGVAGSTAPALAINDLTDVDTATAAATDGQALVYDATAAVWKPATTSSTSGGATTLNGLDDVDTFTVAPTAGQSLVYDSAAALWKPSTVGAPGPINDLTDVDTATVAPTDGQVLRWDATAGLWEPGTVSGGVTAINDLSDVDTVTVAPSTGQALVWDGTQWEPATVSSGATALNDLSDVDTLTTAPQNNQVLTYDTSGQWLPKAVPDKFTTHPLNDVSDVDTATNAPVSGQVLGFNGSLWVPVDSSTSSTTTLQDTGWRNISPASGAAWSGQWYIRRVGKTVMVQLHTAQLQIASTGDLDMYTLPDGFRMQQVTAINLVPMRVGTVATSPATDRRDLAHYSAKLRFQDHPGGTAAYYGQAEWFTDDAFPATYPGTAV